MFDINQKIIEKINRLVGDDAPQELKEFFKEILKQETRQETEQAEGRVISTAYKTILDKYSQQKKILDFIGDGKN